MGRMCSCVLRCGCLVCDEQLAGSMRHRRMTDAPEKLQAQFLSPPPAALLTLGDGTRRVSTILVKEPLVEHALKNVIKSYNFMIRAQSYLRVVGIILMRWKIYFGSACA